MSEIFVLPMSSGEYVLQVQDENRSEEHRVNLPSRMLDDLGLPREQARQVIKQSVDVLSDRDAAGDLPPIIDLAHYWDEDSDFRRRLSAAFAGASES